MYQPLQVQLRGGGNYATGIGGVAVQAFSPALSAQWVGQVAGPAIAGQAGVRQARETGRQTGRARMTEAALGYAASNAETTAKTALGSQVLKEEMRLAKLQRRDEREARKDEATADMISGGITVGAALLERYGPGSKEARELPPAPPLPANPFTGAARPQPSGGNQLLPDPAPAPVPAPAAVAQGGQAGPEVRYDLLGAGSAFDQARGWAALRKQGLSHTLA